MKRTGTIRRDPPAGTGTRTGLTLTEMLVSTAVLAMIILIANDLMTQSRRTIRQAQTTIRANANARAVADRLRQDLPTLDKDGFLIILLDLDKSWHVIFTSAGNFQSMVLPDKRSNAARVSFGAGFETDEDGRAKKKTKEGKKYPFRILARRAILNDPTLGTGVDYESLAASYYRYIPQMMAFGFLMTSNEWLYDTNLVPNAKFSHTAYPGGAAVFDDMVVRDKPLFDFPIEQLDQLKDLWPYMISEVSDMIVQWTDGQTYKQTDPEVVDDPDLLGTLKWYWFDSKKQRGARDPLFYTKGCMQMDMVVPFRGEDWPEFRPPNSQLYCAFWTCRKPDTWPRALRIQFKVGKYNVDVDNPDDSAARPYEVIVDLPG